MTPRCGGGERAVVVAGEAAKGLEVVWVSVAYLPPLVDHPWSGTAKHSPHELNEERRRRDRFRRVQGDVSGSVVLPNACDDVNSPAGDHEHRLGGETAAMRRRREAGVARMKSGVANGLGDPNVPERYHRGARGRAGDQRKVAAGDHRAGGWSLTARRRRCRHRHHAAPRDDVSHHAHAVRAAADSLSRARHGRCERHGDSPLAEGVGHKRPPAVRSAGPIGRL